jgi:hypothetical protein
VFSHRPCTGVLVFITVKLNPVDSLHVSDNVKPPCFDELEVHAWNAESRMISEFSRHVAGGFFSSSWLIVLVGGLGPRSDI